LLENNTTTLSSSFLSGKGIAKVHKSLKHKHPEPMDPIEFWTLLGISGLLVIFGGIFAGLTIGLMSLDATNLSILIASGTPHQKKYAARIEPIRKNTHLLLVTLLLANTVVNETLPVLFHLIELDGYQAVLISTALIVVFGE
jgi:Mg2+/Co2+ transporter CorB